MISLIREYLSRSFILLFSCRHTHDYIIDLICVSGGSIIHFMCSKPSSHSHILSMIGGVGGVLLLSRFCAISSFFLFSLILKVCIDNWSFSIPRWWSMFACDKSAWSILMRRDIAVVALFVLLSRSCFMIIIYSISSVVVMLLLFKYS